VMGKDSERPRVELLYFDGCPNYRATRELVERIADELRVQTEIRLVEVSNADAAAHLRFLGSPTVRVNGRDVEPGADQRRDFHLACRVYRSAGGSSRQPSEAWIREALEGAN
jgi:hypothetical protein